ncbi:HD domain-containing protein [Sansalvadorimonas verongulae]|uniref:HD domain-containing protein n=1 Tax=Sansalvadorimonas verongulae TaxID=2172824 RepID=UPI0012BB52A1|nr:HD domain-containing protein [Sansalvadorimonas verongulae]MTI15047.1 HD domain-containing protein [Sansalvadorimonas verongulae]
MKIKKAVANILNLYRQYGTEQYCEDITQLEHALQGAELAVTDGCDEELVAAVFLHDIGHLLEVDGVIPMGDYGSMAHDQLGADYLLGLGFSERVAMLVGSHVQAKRYLCAIEEGYEEQLSDASKETLRWQGGRMSMQEVSDFSSRSDLEEVLMLRRYDELAKETGKRSDNLHQVEDLLYRVLSRQEAVA